MKNRMNDTSRLLLAIGLLSWLIAITLQHAGIGWHALAGFCLGLGVALQLGALWRIRHPARC